MPDWYEEYLKKPDNRVWMAFIFRVLQILIPLWILIGFLLVIFFIWRGILSPATNDDNRALGGPDNLCSGAAQHEVPEPSFPK